MTQPEPIQHYETRSMFSTWVGVVLVFAFFGMLAFVALKMSPRGNDYEKKRAKARVEKLDAAQKENLTALNTYAWVDKTKGVARIPIDHAMHLMLVELPDKKPTAAGPIVAASPSAAPQTSPAPSAAASAPAASATASPAANAAVSPAAKASATPVAKASATPAASPTASTTPKPTSVSGHDSEAHNQPAAAINPPPAPPNTQPGPNTSPAATAPPAPAKAQVSPSPSASPSAPGTPLPVRGKTP
jgi:hypothetical protein